jgi:hypothetical protein
MKPRSCTFITSVLLVSSVFVLVSSTQGAERSLQVHQSHILPDESVRARVLEASGARVFRLAFYEPGCAGDETWAAKTVGCYSVRREHPVPSSAWMDAMKRLLAETRTYATQFERECSGAPEYVVRLESGREPVDAWICLECSQVTLTIGPKMTARGGFDRVAGELRKLMKEAVGKEEGTPAWALAESEFPLEGGALPVDEAPALQGMNPGVRILTRNSPLAPGERRLHLRVDPEGTRIYARVGENAQPEERAAIEKLVKGLVLTPARRNGLPVSAWVEIAYTPAE